MTFTTRRAVIGDSPSLAAVELLTAPEFANFLLEGMFGDASVGAILSWRYRQGGVDSTDWSWVAETDGEIVGAMGAYPVALSRAEQDIDEGEASERNAHFAPLRPLMRDDAFHIARLGVLPKARRRGVASGLVACAVDAARERGHGILTLIVWADNAAAVALYAGLGFERLDTARLAPHPRMERDGEVLLLGKSL